MGSAYFSLLSLDVSPMGIFLSRYSYSIRGKGKNDVLSRDISRKMVGWPVFVLEIIQHKGSCDSNTLFIEATVLKQKNILIMF